MPRELPSSNLRTVKEPDWELIINSQQQSWNETKSRLDNDPPMILGNNREVSSLAYELITGTITRPRDWIKLGTLIREGMYTFISKYGVSTPQFDSRQLIFIDRKRRSINATFIASTSGIEIRSPQWHNPNNFAEQYTHESLEQLLEPTTWFNLDTSGKDDYYDSIEWVKEAIIQNLVREILFAIGYSKEKVSLIPNNYESYMLEQLLLLILVVNLVNEVEQKGGIKFLTENGFNDLEGTDMNEIIFNIIAASFFNVEKKDNFSKLFRLIYSEDTWNNFLEYGKRMHYFNAREENFRLPDFFKNSSTGVIEIEDLINKLPKSDLLQKIEDVKSLHKKNPAAIALNRESLAEFMGLPPYILEQEEISQEVALSIFQESFAGFTA